MTSAGTAGFWSYAHADDEDDNGRLTQLAESVKREYSLITGDALNLFLDRTDISWGDEWRGRLNTALRNTTFFIPVITPRYFQRPECRNELLTFSAQAEGLGLRALVLPILYVEVPGLAEDHPDETVRLIARHQYIPWVDLRLKAVESAEYRGGVHAIAARLAAIAEETVALQIEQEMADAEVEAAATLIDLYTDLEPLLGPWREAVEEAMVTDKQWRVTVDAYDERLRKIERSSTPGARFATIQRMALAVRPIAARVLQLSETYASATIEMDPLVSSIIRLLAAHPEERETVRGLRESVMEASQEITWSTERLERPGVKPAYAWSDKYAHLSQLMRQVSRDFRAEYENLDEANRIVQRWEQEFSDVFDSVEETSSNGQME